MGFRTAAVGVLWSTALAVAWDSGLPVVAAEVTIDKTDGVPADASLLQADIGTNDSDAAMVPIDGNPPPEPIAEHQGSVDADPVVELRFERAVAETGMERPIKERAAHDVTDRQMAQFQLPPATPGEKAPATQLPTRLTYQYAYGSESEIAYRRDRDLDKRLRDNSNIATPQLNGIVIYRPTDWLESTLEMILDKEIPLQEEDRVTLPNGETQVAKKRRVSLLVDQAFVRIHNVTAPFELNAGRRNYEDERHWLYDTSMDIASIALKQGYFRAEATAGREVRWDLDLAPHQHEVKDRINTYMLYADYRGIEDIRLAGYTIRRDDHARKEGQPRHIGVRALGTPSENLSYWTELAYLRGTDEFSKKFAARAFDVGITYRSTGLPLYPSVTLGYAFATGDGNPNDSSNHEFRQSGLQSNEARIAGVSKFKYYGEALDPELSNLKILTVDLGFRPAPNVSVDLVFHRYRLDKIAEAVRNWALTAEMNQVDTRLSTDLGSGFDIVLGFRKLFGLRLGLDLRAGWIFPGTAFLRNDGTDAKPVIRDADKGFTIVAKFWW